LTEQGVAFLFCFYKLLNNPRGSWDEAHRTSRRAILCKSDMSVLQYRSAQN
jgi:hypothetical protein